MKDFGTTTSSTLSNQPTGDQRAASAAHTPGPWAVDDSRIYGGITVRRAHHTTPAPVAEVWHNGDDVRANARLIAAAPELLAACKDCLEGRGDWMAVMGAAIAKAEGR